MKFVGSIVAFAVSASASHATCANATMAMDGVRTNTTFPAYTMAAGTTDAPFEALCTGSYYQDYFWTYTATCTGVGLVSFIGNTNVSNIKTGVFTGGCAAPALAGQSDSSSRYLAADMTASCDSQSRSLDPFTGEYVQSNQFVAVLGTVYTIVAARTNSNNITGSEPGEDFFQTLITCSAPASNDCTKPTEVTEGTFTYSNVGGAAQTSCTGGNDVFLQYTATCSGSVNFTMIGGAGYHGEDLKMAVSTACGAAGEVVCQDDPAVIYANASAADKETWGTNNGAIGADGRRGGLMGGLTKGTKYLIQVGSYSSAVSPFVFDISQCEGTDASSAVTLAAPLVALFAMLF